MKLPLADLNTGSRLVLTVVLCCAFGYLLGLLHPLIPEGTNIVPVTFIALLASPITIAITIISKISDVNKAHGLSSSERRRIVPILKQRRQSLQVRIFIYTILSILIGVFLFVSTLPAGKDFAIWIYRAVGASVAFAVATSSFMIVDLGKLNDFESLLIRRNAERKSKAAILKKMNCSKSA